MTYTTQIIDRFLTDSEPNSAATYSTYTLTTEHAASSYGVPVLVGPDGTVYGCMDKLPNGETADMNVFLASWDSPDALAAATKFRLV